ncbi:uncharacterized protein EV154DRAFT_475777 [Mucor mucedo]|uniref:uncharacterized protein n=1 Tax=Mucor mucedo TaxID=29922 RepID=UPI00221F6424|nr:uncharacterized protein EV154DRAFT_475777 [Mucor mucedo]KAI7896979.1 hypothetical protein EV154DRAFT_475777 [Mucor mucedo]
MLFTSSLFLIAGAAQAYAATTTSSSFAPQFSPIFPNMKKATGVVTSYNPNQYKPTDTLDTSGLSGYPNPWEAPSTTSAEVKAAYNLINWSKVPKAPVRKQKSNGDWVSDSDGDSDPYCWWSSTNCLSPKASYLPDDIYTCPKKGDWGLNYDDGPFNRYTDENAKKENPYAEPALYNFLQKTEQKSTLFYIGSNVATYPAAAKRGLNDGHQLCSHTWSHPVMTTQTNIQIVAELYWTLKAIKEATGVTVKCWRPPQGDVDDRVRSIAWQMGMRTILWDEDTNDWAMPAPGGGDLAPKKVDAYFAGLIKNEKAGKYKTGHIVLEHELNSATVNMSMFWMPKIQAVFNVVPALTCNNILQPYWEENFVYPAGNSGPSPPASTTTASPAPVPTGSPSTCTPGSFGLGQGDGYNGACCNDQSDCLDDCLSGSCNGEANPNAPVTTAPPATATTASPAPVPTGSPSTCTAGSFGLGQGDGYNGACCKDQSDCLDDCLSGSCNGLVNPNKPVTTTTKKTTTTTKKTTTTTKKATTTTKKATTTTKKATTTTKKATTTTKKPTATASCIAGARGKKKGNGKTGYCCSSSDDCLETCRSGTCGL